MLSAYCSLGHSGVQERSEVLGMYIDIHAHLDKYDSEIPQVIGEIEINQILTVSVAMDSQAYLKSKTLNAQCRWIVSTFGIHPWNAASVCDLQALDGLVAESPMIGEIGLDYHFIADPRAHGQQRVVFKYFVAKGISQNKILNIHSKGAEAEVEAILTELSARRVILHWYSGPIDTLRKLTEKGFYVTVGVEMLFDPHIQAIAMTVPAELLLTETDNPGGYRWLTGTSGTPVLIKSVVDKLSVLRGWSHEQTQSLVLDNFERLVEDDKWARPYKRNMARLDGLAPIGHEVS
jgi:TatD DNase family protein